MEVVVLIDLYSIQTGLVPRTRMIEDLMKQGDTDRDSVNRAIKKLSLFISEYDDVDNNNIIHFKFLACNNLFR